MPIQYTIRGIPEEIDRALRSRAHRRKISLNRLLVEELSNSVRGSGARKCRSLDGIAGAWKPDAEFDRVLEEQRRIDRSLWE